MEKLEFIKDSLAKMKELQGQDNWIEGDEYLYPLADRGHLERLVEAYEQSQKEIKQYQLQETLLLERLKKMTLELKQMKHDRRLISFYEMAEENLKLAQELALLKGEMSG